MLGEVIIFQSVWCSKISFLYKWEVCRLFAMAPAVPADLKGTVRLFLKTYWPSVGRTQNLYGDSEDQERTTSSSHE